MVLDIFLIIVGSILIIIGFIGCILPVLPGIPLSYIGIILLHLSSRVEFSLQFLVIWGLVVIVVQTLDYFVPIWGTKKFGGGTKGLWGSAIGVVLGIFIIPPFGIFIMPFVGAFVGELIDKKEPAAALKAGFGSFMGLLAGTLIKLVVASIFAFVFFKEVVHLIWKNI